MKLYTSPASPFGRKVRIAAALLDVALDIVPTDIADPDDAIRRVNPLGKIPALVPDDGMVIHDSAVICEYLDHHAGGGRILPAPGSARFAVLAAQAAADGLTEAAILQVYEGRFRPASMRVEGWVAHQRGKVERALACFEDAGAPSAPGMAHTVADIALACALGYLDLRFDGRWRAGHPRLASWLDGFAAAVPAFAATRFEG